MYKKILNKLGLIIFIVTFAIIGYYLSVLLDEKYINKTPKFVWFILFTFAMISIEIDKKRGKKLYSIFAVILFVFVQTLILIFPEFHEFIYNLFKWSVW